MPTLTSTPTSCSASPAKPAGPVTRIAIIALMATGSVAMWIGVPLGLLYAVSRMVKTTQPSLGPYMIILFGVPIGMTIIGKGLGALDRYYQRRTQALSGHYRPGWLKSMRGERRTASHWTVLDIVMIASVATALLVMAIWFFFFAGSSIG